MRNVAMRETSLEAFWTIPASELQRVELQIMALFHPATAISRQQIAEITHIPINSVAGRVRSLLDKGALIEDGERRCPHTGKRQYLLRLPKRQPDFFQ